MNNENNQQPQHQGQQPQNYYGQPMQAGPNDKVPNGMGIASLVLGILGLVTSICYIGFLLALLAMILGIAQLVVFGKNKDKSQEGKGMAIAGVILSALTLIFAVFIIIVLASFWQDIVDQYYVISN